MEIIWRASALNDLEAVRDFIAQDNPRAAVHVLTAIGTAVDRLGRSGAAAPGGARPHRAPTLLARTDEVIE